MSGTQRILLLADRGVADLDRLPAVVRWLVDQEAAHVTVLAPLRVAGLDWLTGDTADAEADAQQRLLQVQGALRERGVDATGAVADDDPVGAVVSMVADQPVDVVVVFRPADGDLMWRERDLGDRLRAELTVPLVEVTVGADGVVGPHGLGVDPDAPGGSVGDRESPAAVEPNEPA